MMKSLKDQKIMAALIEDARMPLSLLAKKTKLSREVVEYRLKNLRKELISGYEVRLNLQVFFPATYTLYLNIRGLKRKEVLAQIKELPHVHWVGSLIGKWNYIITFSVTEEEPLPQFLDQLSALFEKALFSYQLTEQVREYKDTFSGLFGKNQLIVSQKKANDIKLDKKDRKIIDLLTKNARMSNALIAEKVNLTREGVRLRIKQLEKKEVILGYRTLIRPQSLDLTSYFIIIRATHFATKVLEEIGLFLANHKSFSYVGITTGEVNVIGVLTVQSLSELDNICAKLRETYPEKITEIGTLPLVMVGEQHYLP